MRLPGPTNRTVIVGGSGSGKSTFGTWLLSRMNWDQQPWIIVDYKYDELIVEIPGIETIGIDEKLPRKAGLYIVHPTPAQDDKVEAFMWRVWNKERVGLFFDEGYLVPDKEAFRTLLVTGRSKHIPIITNSQQPVRVPRHVLSEASFYVVFRLNDTMDEGVIRRYVKPLREQDFSVLPPHYSYYYDAVANEMTVLKPVPDGEHILGLFDQRLKPDRSFSYGWR